MPGMDGFEATKLLRTTQAAMQCKPSFVSALSAQNEHVLRQRMEREKVDLDAIHSKPFSMAIIKALVGKAWLRWDPEHTPGTNRE